MLIWMREPGLVFISDSRLQERQILDPGAPVALRCGSLGEVASAGVFLVPKSRNSRELTTVHLHVADFIRQPLQEQGEAVEILMEVRAEGCEFFLD